MERMPNPQLSWPGRGPAAARPGVLHELPDWRCGDGATGRLVHGDNLPALLALEPELAGQVKCVFLDPPYNTGGRFAHYDDGLESSQWLAMLEARLRVLHRLLAPEGSLWICVDDHEAHYLKVLCDEIMGRANFLCDIAWEKRYAPPPDPEHFGYVHDHLLVYRKGPAFQRELLPPTSEQTGRYRNPDHDPRGPWKAMDYTCRFSAEARPNLYYPVTQPTTGEAIWPRRTRVWAMSQEVHQRHVAEGRLWWGARGTNRVPALKNFLAEVAPGMVPMSLWKHTLAGHTHEARREMRALFGEADFATPKPEALLATVLTVATRPGDLVLDAFAGSGTTGAVAHKMGRRWVLIERGEQCRSHALSRMRQVVAGTDQGGVSARFGWGGGGGFRGYRCGMEDPPGSAGPSRP